MLELAAGAWGAAALASYLYARRLDPAKARRQWAGFLLIWPIWWLGPVDEYRHERHLRLERTQTEWETQVDPITLTNRHLSDVLVWALPATEEERERSWRYWTEETCGLERYSYYEWVQYCEHIKITILKQDTVPGFGEVVAVRCEHCRCTTVAMVADWLEDRTKLSSKHGRCLVGLYEEAICSCAQCTYKRSPRPAATAADYYS